MAQALPRDSAAKGNMRLGKVKSQHSTIARDGAINGAPPTVKVSFDQLPDSGFARQSMLLEQVIPVSSATLWRMVAAKTFPAPVKLSANVTAWSVRSVRAWQAAQAEQAA